MDGVVDGRAARTRAGGVTLIVGRAAELRRRVTTALI